MPSQQLPSLAEQWDSYAKDVLPNDASTTQRWETRRAYYAGAYAVLCNCYGIGDESVSEEEAMRSLSSMIEECDDFKDQVKQGRA